MFALLHKRCKKAPNSPQLLLPEEKEHKALNMKELQGVIKKKRGLKLGCSLEQRKESKGLGA